MSNAARLPLGRLVTALAGSLLLAGCDRGPTGPEAPRAASTAAHRDSSLTCRSGYVIVDGRTVCADQ